MLRFIFTLLGIDVNLNSFATSTDCSYFLSTPLPENNTILWYSKHMARVYQPQPWTSNSGMSFEPGGGMAGSADTKTPGMRRITSVSGGPRPPLGALLKEEYQAHRGYYRVLVGVGVFVVIIIVLIARSMKS